MYQQIPCFYFDILNRKCLYLDSTLTFRRLACSSTMQVILLKCLYIHLQYATFLYFHVRSNWSCTRILVCFAPDLRMWRLQLASLLNETQTSLLLNQLLLVKHEWIPTYYRVKRTFIWWTKPVLIILFVKCEYLSGSFAPFSPQQREEKQLEAAVESLISRVAHVKNALLIFIFKLENEYERLTW